MRRRAASIPGIALLTAGVIACDHGDGAPALVTAPVIHGDDDRRDWFDATDPGFADLLERSTVALVDPRYIDTSDPDHVVPSTMSLGDYKDLCDGQRFADQPAMASCSGTLIDDDLVLTAAHCVDDAVCASWYFVLGFYMAGPGELNRMTADDLYRCDEVVLHRYTEDASEPTWHDYAVVRLDRPVGGHRAPAPIAANPSALRAGNRITTLGFGNGIPGKIHGGAQVSFATPDWGYFGGTTDTFAGNSGSGTYNASHELVGVFTRGGDDDYVAGPTCAVVNTVAESKATQEYDYVDKIIDDLCSGGYPSARLCGTRPGGSGEAGPDGPEGIVRHCGAGAAPPTAGVLWLVVLIFLAARRRRIGVHGETAG